MIKEFINASAGTGKTYNLLNNIFEYQNNDIPSVDYNTALQRINKSVFLTFSNSATEEIKDRIFKGLSKCKNKPAMSLSEEIASAGQNIKVYTIHSFSLEMLRLFRYSLGLPAEISFNDTNDDIWTDCVKEFFITNWNYTELKNILDIHEENKEETALFNLFWYLIKEESLKNFFINKGTTVFFLASMEKTSTYNLKDVSVKNKIKELFKNLNIDTKKEYLKEMQKVQDKFASIESCKIDKTKENSVLNENLDFIKTVCSLLNMCDFWTEKMLLHIGEKFYTPKMFAYGIFDFDSVIYLFVKELLLKDINKFLDKLKDEDFYFENLYIDESQDNNVIQNFFITIFGKKSCPIKVTVVGDPKQSIYGWRDSYPKEFLDMEKECSKKDDIKKTSLTITQRLISDTTRNAINKTCNTAKEQYPDWWYNTSEDLKHNKTKTTKEKAVLEQWTMNKLSPEYKKRLIDFLKEGKNAVLIRKRKNLTELDGIQEVLNEIKANYSLQNSVKDNKEDFLLNPELSFIKIFFASLSTALITNVPFAMFWSESGKLITHNIFSKMEKKKTFIERFKTAFNKLFDDAQENFYSDRIETIYKFLEEHLIWNFMQHKNIQNISPLEIRRIFCHILTLAQIKEKNKLKLLTGKNFIDTTQTIIENGPLPLSYFRIEENADNSNSTEVITIHSSKGLTYDKVVIVSDNKTSFFNNSENLKDYDNQYSSMFNVDFKNILSDNPEIKVSYFPYLSTFPAKILRIGKNYELWDNSQEIYQKIKALITSENLNLLYVAITRTKKDIILIDTSKPAKDKEAFDVFTDFKKHQNYEEKKKSSQEENKEPVIYLNNCIKYIKMNITKNIKTKSVRTEINSKIHNKYGKGQTDSLGRINNAKLGSMLHNAVQLIIQKVNSADDFISYINNMKGDSPKSSLHEKTIKILEKNINVIEENKNLFKEKYKFYNEVPIWHIEQDNTLIKGSIDTLGFKEDKALIIEYKVIFNKDDSQKKLADLQMDLYKKMLEFLKTSDFTIEKKNISFSALN